ncbi:hypothetical protein OPT61_g3595 [Boeremia exigua]|uniref:Uncharacterized protein n=1 Tax=Boeremia exigua TaxID=749465 RepID=A0ACC2IHD0_9PLEO|nr:hypothetical protein OPT61_g3595 [Boeremia exigua]
MNNSYTYDDYVLQFPDVLPPDTQVNVPFPVNNHPEWTTAPYIGVDIPPTFDNLITLPDARQNPALYAAAVDTIRMTNRYFNLVGQYSKSPLTEEHVRWMQEQWPSTVNEAGKRVRLFPVEDYPMPPDGRTLFVKDAMGDPTDRKRPVLWIKACDSVSDMSTYEWEQHLGYTREYLIELSEKSIGADDTSLVLDIFKRYLVWHELVEGESERAQNFLEAQPSFADLEEFFDREEVKEKGATLVDICHAFPHAMDAQMLVYRVEHFATLERQPSEKSEQGVDDPVESRYIRKRDPSRQGTQLVLVSLLRQPGDSVSFSELAERYWPSTANRKLVSRALKRVATPDVTTGRFIFKEDVGPSSQEIEGSFEEQDFLNGFRLEEVAESFPNHVTSLDLLLDTMTDIVYFDEDEQLYYPLYKTEDDEFCSREESMALRDESRIRSAFKPEIIHHDYVWNRETMQYVLRPEPAHPNDNTGIDAQLDDLESFADTIPSEPTEPDVVISLHVPVAAVETIPVEPPTPQNRLQGGVIAAVGTTPIVPTVPAAENPSDPKISPSASAEPAAGRARPPKRAATEAADPSRGSKKARKAPKIQCSGRTQKGARCKKRKDREDGEEQWHCAVHKYD